MSVEQLESAYTTLTELKNARADKFQAKIESARSALGGVVDHVTTSRRSLTQFWRENNFTLSVANNLITGDGPGAIRQQVKNILQPSFDLAKTEMLKGNFAAANTHFEKGFTALFPKLQEFGIDGTHFESIRHRFFVHVFQPLQDVMAADEKLKKLAENARPYVSARNSGAEIVRKSNISGLLNKAQQLLGDALKTVKSNPFMSVALLAIAGLAVLNRQNTQTEI